MPTWTETLDRMRGSDTIAPTQSATSNSWQDVAVRLSAPVGSSPNGPLSLGQPLPGIDSDEFERSYYGDIGPRIGLGTVAGVGVGAILGINPVVMGAMGGVGAGVTPNRFMGFMDWLNGFSRIATQTVGGFVEAFDTGRWDFDYNWWRYDDPEDPNRSLRSGGAMITNTIQGAFMGAAAGSVIPVLGTLAGGIAGGVAGLGLGAFETFGHHLIPDTPEQAAAALREQTARIKASTDNPLVSKMSEALPFLAGFWNEHTMAEMAYDPLAAVADFGIGRWMTGGMTRAATRALTPIVELPMVAPLAQAAQKAVMPVRRIYNTIADTTGRAVRASAEEGGRELFRQFAQHDLDLRNQMDALRETVGDEAFLQLNEALPHVQEALPGTLRITNEVADTAMANVLAGPSDSRTLPFAQTTILEGAAERRAWLTNKFAEQFPEMPTMAHELAANVVAGNVNEQALIRAFEAAKGIPLSTLGDIQYLYHLTTPEHHTALRAAVGEMTGDALEEWYRSQRALRNVIGDMITEPMRSRNIRETLAKANQHEWGYVRGKPKLEPGRPDSVLEADWIPIEGKLFSEDFLTINLGRAARSVRTVGSADFWREFGATFGSPEAKPGWFTAKGVLTSNEWERTFGRLAKQVEEAEKLGPLSPDLQATKELVDIASTYHFPDKATVKAGLAHYQIFRAMQAKPNLILRWFARGKGVWGAATLTPFTSSANRNIIGGMIVSGQKHGAAAVLGDIEVRGMIERGDPLIRKFADGGLFSSNWTTEIYRAGEATVDVVPWQATTLKSTFKAVAQDPLGTLFPVKLGTEGVRGIVPNEKFLGNSIYSYIDNVQRAATALVEHRRGASIDEAIKTAIELHHDYGDVPAWYNTIRPMLSFPTWAIKMIPLQARLLVENPAWYAKAGRFAVHSQEATGMSEAETPSIVAEGGGFGVPAYDPSRPMWFRPENFDPIAIWSDISDPFKFAYDMFNPFVTEPIEQLAQAERTRSGYEAPRDWGARVPLATEGGENLGFDPFFHRPIVRDFTKFNEALPLIGGTQMPDFMQRLDHVARSFLRYYTEASSLARLYQNEYKPRGEGLAEITGRRLLGVPIYWQPMDQATYFNLRDVDTAIGDEEGRSEQRPDALKDLYIRRLALLAHGTFAQQDPFTGELRHWDDYGKEDGFTMRGRQAMWDSAIDTCWLLLMGSTGPGNQQRLQEPIPLSETEEQYIEGLMYRLLDTYTLEVMNASARGEADYSSSMGYVEDRLEALSERE